MSQPDIIRAWKDQEYCNSLSAAERALLPENPAGIIELTDAELQEAAGGSPITIISITLPFCYTMFPLESCITFCVTVTAPVAE